MPRKTAPEAERAGPLTKTPSFPALVGLLILVVASVFAAPLRAAPYAAMVMDARTGEVLHARNADTRLHPASLTKMMTLYVAFEAIRLGEITLDTPVRISELAASEPPSELGLRAGSTIRFRYLIRAAAIRSANDAATAIAEAVSGSEAAFARRMTRTAQALGMTRTTFRNAHGLTEEGHLSTARDMTIMGRRLFYDYPQYYNLFSRRETDAGIATVRNTNRALLDAYRGADGIKTGYTRAAGFNLVASAERGQERIIATVFGGQSAASRNQRIMELLDMGFARAPSRAVARVPSPPSYADVPTGRTTRATGAVTRSLRPVPRPLAEPEPALLAAISDAVVDALDDVGAAVPEPAPEIPAPETGVAAAAPPEDMPLPVPRPTPEVARPAEPDPVEIAASPAPPPAPVDVAAEDTAEDALVVTRASSSGGRLYSVSLGLQGSHHSAERLLLRTALSEIGTFDDALRRVVRRGEAQYEATFHGLSEVQASRACARLSARAMDCSVIGPSG